MEARGSKTRKLKQKAREFSLGAVGFASSPELRSALFPPCSTCPTLSLPTPYRHRGPRCTDSAATASQAVEATAESLAGAYTALQAPSASPFIYFRPADTSDLDAVYKVSAIAHTHTSKAPFSAPAHVKWHRLLRPTVP